MPYPKYSCVCTKQIENEHIKWKYDFTTLTKYDFREQDQELVIRLSENFFVHNGIGGHLVLGMYISVCLPNIRWPLL